MALEYKSQKAFESVTQVLDDYIVWYGRLIKSYFESKEPTEKPPIIFDEWLRQAMADKSISDPAAERIRAIHTAMIKAAKEFSTLFYLSQNLPLKEYEEFNRHYEEFIQFMRRIELDKVLDNSGFDELTGLRSVKVMHDEIARELDRRSRRGNPFSIGLVKIENYKPEWQNEEENFRVMIRQISSVIKDCLRTFDDAYYLGDQYFVLSLKHADSLGSQAAMSRLNSSIKSTHISRPDNPHEDIRISGVLFEPTPGDSLDTLIENMKNDLEGLRGESVILQHSDISPLQRYLHSIDKKK